MDIQKLIQAREGGRVERCHTLPYNGSYSNSQHQWGASMLYLQLRGDTAEFKTLKAILTHDLGERWLGDIPSPAKWQMNPETWMNLNRIEANCLEYLGCAWPLTPLETSWLHAVDLLELFFWGHEQIAMGNKNCEQLIFNILLHVDKTRTELPDDVLYVYRNYKWTRTSDTFPY